MSGHALLAPSSSKMWLTCTRSARDSEGFTDTSGFAADEGTNAHAIGELGLLLYLGKITKEYYEARLNVFKVAKWKDGRVYWSQQMQEYCDDYVTAVINAVHEDSLLLIEHRVDFSKWVREGKGTTDANVITPLSRLSVNQLGKLVQTKYVKARKGYFLDFYDLKYGKGVEVSAIENTQLMCYALGVISDYDIFDITHVRLNIYQPRMDNFSQWEIPIDDLMEWADTYLAPRAKLAWEGKGDYVVGDHCKFCKAKPRCKAIANFANEEAAHVFSNSDDLLPDDEMVRLYSKLDIITSWAGSVKDYMLAEALKGKQWKGLKVVEGTSRRYFIDETKAAETYTSEGYYDIWKAPALKPLGELETMMGKKAFNVISKDLLGKPKGAPALVNAADGRPLFNSAETVFKQIIVDDLI